MRWAVHMYTKGGAPCRQRVAPHVDRGWGHMYTNGGATCGQREGPHVYQATTLWQLEGPVHQDVDPAPVMVGQTARRMYVVQESNHALSAANVLGSSFWETEDAERKE